MAEWFSIEVLNGPTSARTWANTYGDSLVNAALSARASDWSWHHGSWGSVLEVELEDDQAWEAFRALAAVRAALDAVPDPANGLIVYRGRGGSSPASQPRRPRPLAGAGAASLPLPEEDEIDGVVPAEQQWLLSGADAPAGRGASASGSASEAQAPPPNEGRSRTPATRSKA